VFWEKDVSFMELCGYLHAMLIQSVDLAVEQGDFLRDVAVVGGFMVGDR
jgi:hypothetical protein